MKKPKTASQILESLNEFLLGPEPDFKTMPPAEVTAYLKKNKLDPEKVYTAAKAMLKEAKARQNM